MTNILGHNARLDHFCIVVSDLERAKRNFALLTGAAVPESMDNYDYQNMHIVYRGQPQTQSGLSQTHFGIGDSGISIEIIQPNEGASIWREHLSQFGDGLHHIAYVVQEKLETVGRRCEEHGMIIVQSGEFEIGHYLYVDARKFIGCFLELVEFFSLP